MNQRSDYVITWEHWPARALHRTLVYDAPGPTFAINLLHAAHPNLSIRVEQVKSGLPDGGSFIEEAFFFYGEYRRPNQSVRLCEVLPYCPSHKPDDQIDIVIYEDIVTQERYACNVVNFFCIHHNADGSWCSTSNPVPVGEV